MSITSVVTTSVRVDSNTVTATETIVTDTAMLVSDTITGAGTAVTTVGRELTSIPTFTASKLRYFYASADKNMTLFPIGNFGAAGAITLVANVPYSWNSSSGFTNPFLVCGVVSGMSGHNTGTPVTTDAILTARVLLNA